MRYRVKDKVRARLMGDDTGENLRFPIYWVHDNRTKRQVTFEGDGKNLLEPDSSVWYKSPKETAHNAGILVGRALNLRRPVY